MLDEGGCHPPRMAAALIVTLADGRRSPVLVPTAATPAEHAAVLRWIYEHEPLARVLDAALDALAEAEPEGAEGD
ncbi:MAG TPA: hypothetical protein VNJ53_01300 [Gaiellaceae bacterium]|nr:hypothetical protein [Gaiellaceae bacterium]